MPCHPDLFCGGFIALYMRLKCKHCGEVDADTTQNGPHISAYCTVCGSFIKHVPKIATDFTFYFGKYKNRLASEVVEEDRNYCEWVLENVISLNGTRKEILKSLLDATT